MPNDIIARSTDMHPRPNRSLFVLKSTGKFAEEPNSDNYSWVTVELPSSMKPTHNDQMLLETTIYRTPQHWERYGCISFPVQDDPVPDGSKAPLAQVTHTIMTQAEYIAKNWLQELRDGKATLKKKRISGIGMDSHAHREMDE
ncbi:Cwf15/Cwc15 cell cycle control protein [Penicillium cf. viridicatum]|uniref:Cwf15/Cwc15 cell cycle control protein n=1 Tax=Penicillium cf. viridicatum TaxID=2972119 RepID=A0A9W9J2X2_9EURO|nr:Cwf15/Cwc15 cell cycle control protein [Penicillium cf. viridicatum]